MRSLLKIGLGLLGLALILIGMSYSMLRAQGTVRAVDGASREVVSETRKLGPGISAVHLNGPIDMTLRQGAVPSLVIKGEQRLMGNIEAWQDKGVLHIAPRGMLLHHRQPLQAVLVLSRLDKLTINGSGDSTVNGFSGERIEVALLGSGNLKFNGRFRQVAGTLHGNGDLELNGGTSEQVALSVVGSGDATVVGSCDRFELEQTGSGDVDAEHLASTSARVNLLGTGAVVLNVRDQVDVRLRGSGDVLVHGDPAERTISKTGSGEVEFR
jgi:hypothetical protein